MEEKGENSRSREYKNRGKDVASLRKRRADNTVELRKVRRWQQLDSRRQTGENGENMDLSLPPEEGATVSVSDALCWLGAGDVARQLTAVTVLRNSLTEQSAEIVDGLVVDGRMSKLLVLAEHAESDELQFGAAALLAEMAFLGGITARAPIGAGAVPVFVQLLACSRNNVCSQATMALGALASESTSYRDEILAAGGFYAVKEAMMTNPQPPFVRMCANTLSMMCRGKSPPIPLDLAQAAIALFTDFLRGEESLQPLDDGQEGERVGVAALWGLCYVAGGGLDRICIILDPPGLLSSLVELLSRAEDEDILLPVLSTVGYLVTGTDDETQAVLDCGLLPRVVALLAHDRYNVVQLAAWILANVTAGSRMHVQMCLDSGAIVCVLRLLSGATCDYRTRREVTWALANTVSGASFDQIADILQLDIVEPLCSQLQVHTESSLLRAILDALSRLLHAATVLYPHEINVVAERVEECYAVARLEALESHDNDSVYTAASELLQMYFVFTEGEEDWDDDLS